MEKPFVFFAVLGYKEQPVRRLVIEESAQDEITREFSNQRETFYKEKSVIEFKGGNFNCDSEEIFCAKNFVLTHQDCYDDYHSLEVFRPGNNRTERIKAIVALDTDSRDLMFQSYHSLVTMGAERFSFLFSNNTFKRINSFAVAVGTKLAALYHDNDLYFHSVQAIQSFINIAETYKAASDSEITKILSSSPKLMCEDIKSLLGIVNTKTRKLFSMLSDSPAITDKNLSAEKIGEIAEKNGVLLDVQDGKIVIPSANKGELTAALDFLAENVFIGPLSNERYVTNSKRKME